MSRSAKYFRLLTIGVLAAAMIGCESNEKTPEEAARVDPEDVQDSILWDLTPELMAVTDRPDDLGVKISRRFNYDLRMFWDDWMNALYWDRPSRLNRRPMP